MPSFPVPQWIRMLVLVTCLAVLASALAAACLALAAPMLAKDQRPGWALFGFELVIMVACVLGVLFGRGRFTQGPGLAVACIGGTILVASGLGWAGSGKQLVGHSLTPLLGARLLAVMVIGGSGAWCVLSRDRRSFRPAIIGALCVIPVVIGAGAILLPKVRLMLDHAFKSQQGLSTAAAVGAFVVGGILLSAGIHLLIKAFEMGRAASTSESA